MKMKTAIWEDFDGDKRDIQYKSNVPTWLTEDPSNQIQNGRNPI